MTVEDRAQADPPRWPSGDYHEFMEIFISVEEVERITGKKFTKFGEGPYFELGMGLVSESGNLYELMKYSHPIYNKIGLRFDSKSTPELAELEIVKILGLDSTQYRVFKSTEEFVSAYGLKGTY